MNEHKKLAYLSEDTFKLGISLPVVAMRQLPKIAEQFNALPDHPDYLPGAQRAMAYGIMKFYNDNKRFMDDERELREAFTEACKLHKNSHYTLAMFASR